MTLENTINIPAVKSYESLPQLDLELMVTVYVVKDETGTPGITNAAVVSALDRVNNAFSLIKVKFHICAFNYIDNYQFNIINGARNERDLLIQHYSTNTINLYFASGLIDKFGSEVNGYALMPSELKDAIFLRKDMVSSNEIIHQFGHFFNLYHTHETAFGNEVVKNVNCDKTGDRCCDTPADPVIAGFVDNNCEYTGAFKDNNNQFYIPSTQNFMSFGKDACRCTFTNDQYMRIIYTINNLKKNLW
ncbi:MAG: hypothetical protein HC830_06060 [Bacteroidetes bacterium]|nr:hypothetical protein [Bacteroidota bacterium]